MKKNSGQTAAAIDVGTNFIRMMLAEITPEGTISPLEDVWKPTQIGRDTFSTGKIELASTQELCKTLKSFAQLMKDYRVKNYQAIATTGIREAQNREYVLDQICLRTGLKVEVINNLQERFYEFKSMRDSISDLHTMSQDGLLVVSLGMGGTEIFAYHDGSLQFTEYVKIGSLRLRELLADLERVTLEFSAVLEEFLERRIYWLDSLRHGADFKYIIGLGGELPSILRLAQLNQLAADRHFLEKAAMEKVYSLIKNISPENIVSRYKMHRNEAEILLPSAIIFRRFLNATRATGIQVPRVSLRHGMLANMADERFNTSRKHEYINDIVSSVRHLGRKYGCDEKHSQRVEEMALSIFDQMKTIHNLGERERLYLQVACILHDVGKYINADGHELHSGNVIRAQQILGFANRELAIAANIARYHSQVVPAKWHDNYSSLDRGDQIMVSKLAAILKIANALNVSNKIPIPQLNLEITSSEAVFKVKSKGDFLLEGWSFSAHVDFFEAVYGLKPVLKHKG
ncbi:MAG: HD domain-containing protein [Syntrophomonadaceae bacterium]